MGRITLALLWPIGPMAFVVTIAMLLGASLIAFPAVSGTLLAAVILLWLVL